MTIDELCRHEMSRREQEEWERFCDVIREKCAVMDTPPMNRALLERSLQPREPFYGARGYCEREGYYDIQEGDRGETHTLFWTRSLEEAVTKKLSRIADDLSYEYVVENQTEIEPLHKEKWHYYEEHGPIIGGKMKIDLRENQSWEYDLTYDYRKYWFELALAFLMKVFGPEDLEQEIRTYEDHLNHGLTNRPWVYEKGKQAFVLTGEQHT